MAASRSSTRSISRDGEGAAHDRLVLAKKFGAALIALTIDEDGDGESVRRRSWRVARRLVQFACDQHGLPQSDLLIDPLTFTIATGNEDDRKLGAVDARGNCSDQPRIP